MHTAVHRKARTFIVETWQSQANLFIVPGAAGDHGIRAAGAAGQNGTNRAVRQRGVLTDLDIRGCDCLGPKALAGGCNLRCTALAVAAWLRANYATLIWAEAFSLLAVV